MARMQHGQVYAHFGQILFIDHSVLHLLVGLLVFWKTCTALGPPPPLLHEPETFLHAPPSYEVVYPSRVDVKGHFLSHFLSHHAPRVQRRAASEDAVAMDTVFYHFYHAGHSLTFNLHLNPNLLAPGFLTERRYGGLSGAKIQPPAAAQCHFLGEVWEEDEVRGRAAISTCNGLTGLFKVSEEEFFIEPLEKSKGDRSAAQPHAIYRRHTAPPSGPEVKSISRNHNGTCGVTDPLYRSERQREQWERRQQRRRRVRTRSVSSERWVETLVVADPKMVEHHGSKSVESYVLAVMNIVSGLFGDASLGNAINIVVVRLILLEQDEDELKITHHADNSLNSFCKWQKGLNMKGDDHPLHHDVAVLLTRKDICASLNAPCETLGLSHVAGMCQPHRSCSISEDTGLPLAFTVAHELGHNFGIQHDGNGNDCEPVGKRPFVMSPQLLYGTSLPKWSACSRQYITRFLDRGWGWCLDDSPGYNRLTETSVLPGVLYSAPHQCRLQYGSASVLCQDMGDVCNTLWCTVGKTCHSKLDGAADGTNCGEDKWCMSGECVAVGLSPESVDGGWVSWSNWSACTRTCGSGVQSAHRDCTNPVPKYRGKYCLGERRRYRVCNPAPCVQDQPSFRDMQCSFFNSLPYKGHMYTWISVINKVSPCELHCRPLNEHFSEKMRDAVVDATPCYEESNSRDMCINGICKSVGCDFVIDSSSVEDQCGVCNGNGSTCTTVQKSFDDTEGLGYVDIGLIPEGAWDIRIEEVAEAGNFLALRSDNPNKYFLNGGWTIQWNGEYKAAGTVFKYERMGHLENITSPGPTMEPLWIQLLFQETNPGVRYEYTINQNLLQNKSSVFYWKYGSWSECSVTCGSGFQRQMVYCVERTRGIVEENLCDPLTRPDNNQTSCDKEACPAMWWTGEWQKCSSTCGSLGLSSRTVLCVQTLTKEEQKALQPSDCQHLPKPESMSPCNTHVLCPADWTTGNWSKCSVTCGSGVRRRNITCSKNTGTDCDPLKKPTNITPCSTQECPKTEDNFESIDWSGSGWAGKDILNEINSIPQAKPAPKYITTKAQPKDLNNIIETDFHYHNNIDKNTDLSQNLDKRVHVDDFYYDYNFINFHEDLYNDFESDGRYSGNELDVPQELKPTNNTIEITPVVTIIPTAPSTLHPSTLSSSQDTDKESTTTKDPIERPSEDFNDFLAEDYFLPVFTTRKPRSSPTKHSQTHNAHKDGDGNTSSAPTKEPITHNHAVDSEEAETIAVKPEHMSTVLPGIAPTTQGPVIYDGYINTVQGSEISRQPSDVPTPEIGLTQTTSQSVLAVDNLSETVFTSGASQHDERIGTTLLASTAKSLIDFESRSSHFTQEPTTIIEDDLPHEIPTQIPLHVATTSPAHVTTQATISNSDFVFSEIMLASEATTSGFSHPFLTSTATTLPSVPETTTLATSTAPTSQKSTKSQATAYWVTSNWSACSTSCGLGAVWRSLSCSTGSDSDCDPAKRPAPAQRCYLRPCSTWRVGPWSKCSKGCDGGVTLREVQCFDLRDERPLRPFHCRAMSARPQSQMDCNLQPCLDWDMSSWGQCSEVCGGGEQQRIVTCPEEDQCDRDLQPTNIQLCNQQPCAQWLTGSWGQCSASCGGGVQHRLIKCVDTKAETEEELDHSQCDHEPPPASTEKCQLQECKSSPSGAVCLRDRLTPRFCQTLRWLGRCSLANVRSQCCRTCEQRPTTNTSKRGASPKT